MRIVGLVIMMAFYQRHPYQTYRVLYGRLLYFCPVVSSIFLLLSFFLWPPYVIEQAIIFLPCGFFFLLLSSFFFFLLLSSSFFFPRQSQPSQIGCLPYLHTWCGLSANLRCRSETCCTALAADTGRKKSPKIAIWAPSHKFVRLYLRN